MRWYLSSRTKYRDLIKTWIKILKKNKHDISFDWTNVGMLIPYQEHKKQSSVVAQKISQAIQTTDIFVLLADMSGTDMYVELGLAIANHKKSDKPKIYVIGNRRSLMHYHPSITPVTSIEDVFRKENITL